MLFTPAARCVPDGNLINKASTSYSETARDQLVRILEYRPDARIVAMPLDLIDRLEIRSALR